MLEELQDPTVSSKTLETYIHQRTHGHVKELRVDVTAYEITVYGRVRSYYALQLAIEAAMCMQAERQLPVHVKVQVFQSPSLLCERKLDSAAAKRSGNTDQ